LKSFESKEGSEGAIEKGEVREGERGEGEERCGHNITSNPFASFNKRHRESYLNSSIVKKKLRPFFSFKTSIFCRNPHKKLGIGERLASPFGRYLTP